MAKKNVETGAVNEAPDQIKRNGRCPVCGQYVESSEEHDCESTEVEASDVETYAAPEQEVDREEEDEEVGRSYEE